MKVRYAIKGIKRNLILTLLLIIQLVFAFYALYNTIDINKKVHVESSKIERYFKGKQAYNLRLDNISDIFDESQFPKVNEESLRATFDSLKNTSQNIFTHQVIFPMLVKQFNGSEGFNMYPFVQEIDGEKYFQARNITLNENALKQFDIKLKDGRFFEFNEAEGSYGDINPLPIIVGHNYENFFKIGDEFEYIRPGRGIAKAEIIGILEENQYIPVDMSGNDLNKYMDLNNCIISSYSQFEDYKIMYDTMFGYNFILFDENTSYEEIESINSNIKKEFYNNLGINVVVKDLNKYIKAELNTFENQEKIISITSLTILTFVSMTLIISTLNSILKRKKEFGVHIFSGGTIRDIAITIYLEVLLIIMGSLAISMLIIFYKNSAIDINNLKLLFLNCIIMSVVVTILPIIKIFKMDITDIIKGAE
ncbi:MAG: hypothetical protein ACRC2K_14370 [Clostridium sp.]